jgi:hypothetical protein
MPQIQASVGKYANDTRLCYNRIEDKRVVRDLLNRIGVEQGGPEKDLPEDLLPPPQITYELARAIWDFQKAHVEDFHLIADGHIDPAACGGRAIGVLNKLADEAPPRKSRYGWHRGTRFAIMQMQTAQLYTGQGKDMYFRVVDLSYIDQNGWRPGALYWFGPPNGEPQMDVLELKPGFVTQFILNLPLPADQLAGPGFWAEVSLGPVIPVQLAFLQLNLVVPGTGLFLQMGARLLSPAGSPGSRYGMFQFSRPWSYILSEDNWPVDPNHFTPPATTTQDAA